MKMTVYYGTSGIRALTQDLDRRSNIFFKKCWVVDLTLDRPNFDHQWKLAHKSSIRPLYGKIDHQTSFKKNSRDSYEAIGALYESLTLFGPLLWRMKEKY